MAEDIPIRLNMNDIIQNPYLACDYIFVEEKRELLDKAPSKELLDYSKYIRENKKQIVEILSSASYKEYLNAQSGVKSYSAQIATLDAITTTSIDTATGVPISTIVSFLGKKIVGYIKHRNMNDFFEEADRVLGILITHKRIMYYINKENK